MTRITPQRALELYHETDLHTLGRLAAEETRRRHPSPVRTYIVDRNVNYTNVCTSQCLFCNFCRSAESAEAYVLSDDVLFAKIDELLALGGCQVLLQGGLHPDLPLDWYVGLLRRLKARYERLHVHGFSPPEIVHMTRRSGLTIHDVLAALIDAGLDTIPGGGAEILVERVRAMLSPGKCTAAEWLDVMRTAHRLGLRTTATMMFGHVETDEERIEHLALIRELQDETAGFTAFIPWPFQPAGTRLMQRHADKVRLPSVQDYLRTLSVSRLFLDNVENLQASWVTQGPAIGQAALEFGANDFGSLMLEENVVAAAGTSHRLTEPQLRALIRAAGYVPARRDCLYRLLEQPVATGSGPAAGDSESTV